jgi:hypothetical protein
MTEQTGQPDLGSASAEAEAAVLERDRKFRLACRHHARQRAPSRA